MSHVTHALNPKMAEGIAAYQSGLERIQGALDSLDDLAMVPDADPSDWSQIQDALSQAATDMDAGRAVVELVAHKGEKPIDDARNAVKLTMSAAQMLPLLHNEGVPTDRWLGKVERQVLPAIELADKGIAFLREQIRPTPPQQ